MGMLARGRNAYHIQDELTLSYNTVKTHVKRIYRKLDVHSQQELIDLVEKRRTGCTRRGRHDASRYLGQAPGPSP